MKLLTNELRAQLLANARAQAASLTAGTQNIDFKPVVKLFTPDANATWLLTELHDDDLAFGLCDLGLGCPELGYVNLAELATLRGHMGLNVERDRYFDADKTLAAYAEEARHAGRIVT